MKQFSFFSTILALLLLSGCGGGGSTPPPNQPPAPPALEDACINAGWQLTTLEVGGLARRVLWKGPQNGWVRGAIVVMHGGGGSYVHWCSVTDPVVQPQVDFSQLALAQGFAVFALDSTDDVVTDPQLRTCGKRFDTTVQARPNVDLPFIESVLTQLIPSVRPMNSAAQIYMTGESTGGFMTIRAATHFDSLITAFAPAAAADPYGTYFDCDPALSPRESAHGIGLDADTHRQITEFDACTAAAYPNEAPWVTMNPAQKPAFKQFHHVDDGIVDLSCPIKANFQLRAHGYPDTGAFLIPGNGPRRLLAHLWQSEFNQPMLDFFKSIL